MFQPDALFFSDLLKIKMLLPGVLETYRNYTFSIFLKIYTPTPNSRAIHLITRDLPPIRIISRRQSYHKQYHAAYLSKTRAGVTHPKIPILYSHIHLTPAPSSHAAPRALLQILSQRPYANIFSLDFSHSYTLPPLFSYPRLRKCEFSGESSRGESVRSRGKISHAALFFPNFRPARAHIHV